MTLLQITLPLHDPILIFTLVLFIVLLAPAILNKIGIPDIFGLIMAGVIVGPYGLNILPKEIGLSVFSSVGLLYLMFLAGLEIDLTDFKRNNKKSLIFGMLTFIFPFALGMIVFNKLLDYNITSSLFISIMLASHTLVSYPILGRLGILDRSLVTIIIGGTIIADTAVLVLLGIISNSVQGELNLRFWLIEAGSFLLFFGAIIGLLPRITRWFFKYQQGENIVHYVFVLTAVFTAATLAELLHIEPLIGAFFAGLALNRLIIKTSPLMNRIVFIGNALFIPFFLISVGMLVDLQVLVKNPQTIIILLVMTILALSGKYLAAFFTQIFFKMTGHERNLIFGLSASRAASAIAIMLVGFNLGLINELILNDTVILILITCLLSTFITQHAGKNIALHEEHLQKEDTQYKERILVPVSNPETIKNLLNFSILIKDPASKEPLYPITVMPDDDKTHEKITKHRKELEKAAMHASSTDNSVHIITRVDLNVIDGIARAIKEFSITKIVIGWNDKLNPMNLLFGSLLDKLLKKTEKTIFVTKISEPVEFINKIYIHLPPHLGNEQGYPELAHTFKNIAKNTGKEVIFLGDKITLEKIRMEMEARRPQIHAKFQEIGFGKQELSDLSEKLHEHDMIILVRPRKHSVSYARPVEDYTRRIVRMYAKYNFVLVYPGQPLMKPGIFSFIRNTMIKA